MENFILTKWEKKLLYAIKKYPFADIGDRELHGYFKFPPVEITLSAIGGLKSKGLIQEKEPPSHGYGLTHSGAQYLLQHRLSLFLGRHAVEIILTVLGGVVASAISFWMGFI